MDLTQLEGYELLGRFRLGKLLGQGGYGAVFEAVQLSVGRRCAVKILQAQQIGAADNVVGRFRAEAIVTSRLAHPNTVVIYDFGHDVERDLLFLAMEFLEGRSLHEVLADEGSLPVDVALHVIDQIASSLQDAHEQGVVHRDLKPHNVMIIRRGADDYFVKVIDFGIAKLLAGDVPTSAQEQLTMTGVMVGTPHYMAPEQIRGQPVDGRADIYALGHCVYKLLVGRTCFQGGAPMDIAIRQLSDKPLPLRALDDKLDVSSSFERVVLRALEKEQASRWPTILEFAQALREAARAHRRPPPEPIIQQRAEDRTGRMATIPPTEPLPSPLPSPKPAPAPALAAAPAADPPTGPTRELSGGATAPMKTPAEPLIEPQTGPMRPLHTPAQPVQTASAEPVRVAAEVAPPPVRDGGTLAMPTPVELPAPPQASPQASPQARPKHPTPTDAIGSPGALPLRERPDDERTSAQAAPSGVRAPLIGAFAVGLLLCIGAIALAASKLGGSSAPAAPAAELAARPAAPAPSTAIEPAPAAAVAAPVIAAVPDMAAPAPDMAAPAQVAEPVKEPIKEPVKVTPEPTKDERKSASAKVSVSLQVVIVPYGELYMDGKKIAKGTRMTVSVPPGKHTFEARDQGVTGPSKTVEITPDFKETLRLTARAPR